MDGRNVWMQALPKSRPSLFLLNQAIYTFSIVLMALVNAKFCFIYMSIVPPRKNTMVVYLNYTKIYVDITCFDGLIACLKAIHLI